jgi:hypothetical protein
MPRPESLDDTSPSGKDTLTLRDRFRNLRQRRKDRIEDLKGADSGDIEDTAIAAAAATRAAMASIADSDAPNKPWYTNPKKLAAIVGAIGTLAVAIKELIDIITGALNP